VCLCVVCVSVYVCVVCVCVCVCVCVTGVKSVLVRQACDGDTAVDLRYARYAIDRSKP